MTSPHMTGRRESTAQSKTISPTDLLDDDGKVDISAIHSQANAGQGRVTAVDATEMRRRLANGAKPSDVAEWMGVTPETVRLHARGEIMSYPGGNTPEHPPLRHTNEGWEVVDDA